LKRLLKKKLIKESSSQANKRSKFLEISSEEFNKIDAVRSKTFNMGALLDIDQTEQENTILLTMP